MSSKLKFPNIQAEDQPEGHHWFTVHWSGAMLLSTQVSAYLASKSVVKLSVTYNTVPVLKWFKFFSQWYTLSDVKSGRVHLILEWVMAASQSDRLDQVCIPRLNVDWWTIAGKPHPYSLVLSESSGSSVLFPAVLPEQGGSFSRPAVCLHRASRQLTSESFSTDVKGGVMICSYCL